MAATTALLKSASSTREQLSAYQDQVKAFEYSNSAYTDQAFADYRSYLQSRINDLSSAGSISNASKALTLTKSLDAAGKANISATIQRENIQMMSGNASLTDKYNVIVQQYTRAYANGDLTLAQSLMSQAYSTSQSIQYQAQQAQNAAITQAKAAAELSKSNNTALAKNAASVADTLKQKLDEFNANYSNAGRKAAGKLADDFVKQMLPTFKTLGITLAPGMKPNYFDIVTGVNNAIIKAYGNAYTIAAPTAADGGQSYIDKAVAVTQKIPTIYGNMNQDQLTAAANNPNQFSYREDPQYVTKNQAGPGGTLNQQTGYRMDKNGNINANFAQSPWVQIPNNLNNQIQALHLDIVGNKVTNGVEVHVSSQSPQWLKNIMGGDATTHIVSDAQGNLQFEADGVNGTGKSIYTIAKDNKVWETTNGKGNWLINNSGTMGGHKLTDPQTEASFGFENFKTNMQNWFGGLAHGVGNLLGGIMGHANAMGILDAGTNHFSPPPLPIAPVTPLPSINVPAPMAPAAQISTQPAHNQPVNPFPVQLQAPRSAPQGGAVNIQGGGFNPQQGGKGITIKGTTNAPVGMRF